MKKVVVVYSKGGGGHISLAKSTKEALETYYPGEFEVDFFDPQSARDSYFYQRVSSEYPKIWGLLWYSTNKEKIAKFINKVGSRAMTSRAVKYFAEVKPDVVIINSSMAIDCIEKALKKLKLNTKVVIHLADPFYMHSFWFSSKGADLYLTHLEDSIEEAALNGVPKDKLVATGYLLSQIFKKDAYLKKEVRNKLGLDQHKFVIYVGGSGLGGGKILSLCKRISQSALLKEKCQLIVVSGRNQLLYKKLLKLALNDSDFFKVFGYVDNVSELLAASDIVAGKAGPNFIFEAVFMGKPIFATACLPGQEEGNLEFILRKDIGWVEKDIKKAVIEIERLVSDTKLIEKKITNLEHLMKQNLNSQKRFADEIAKLCQV